MPFSKMPDKQKFIVLGTLLIVSIVLFSLSLQLKSKPATVAPGSNTTDTNATNQTEPTNTENENENTAANNTNQAAAQPNHDEAVKKYAGRILQFNKCVYSAPSTNPTFKNKTTIMLDGWFSPSSQTVTLDGKKYPLKAHSFTFVTLSYTKLPRTVSIDCVSPTGPRYNIGTITVQQ